tara:strand:- start:11 stop:643 length:633 start_codon:yes stop_codon:yes gene_type:complete
MKRLFESWRKHLDEKVFADYEAAKGDWTDIPVDDLKHDPENIDLTDEIFKLIDNSYADIGGHFDFQSAEDVPGDNNVWTGVDLDNDPDLDVVRFGKTKPHGVKLTGSGHDGSRAAKTAYLQKTADMLYEPGYYAEMSKAIAHIMITRYGVPYVTDPEVVQKVLGPKKPIEWLGSEGPIHCEECGQYSGWYTRTIEGHEGELKIMLGNPNA